MPRLHVRIQRPRAGRRLSLVRSRGGAAARPERLGDAIARAARSKSGRRRGPPPLERLRRALEVGPTGADVGRSPTSGADARGPFAAVPVHHPPLMTTERRVRRGGFTFTERGSPRIRDVVPISRAGHPLPGHHAGPRGCAAVPRGDRGDGAPWRGPGSPTSRAIESRASSSRAVALRLGAGSFRSGSRGSCRGARATREYALEYGTEQLEIHVDACPPASRVLLVDDVLATGGTRGARAACRGGGRGGGGVRLLSGDGALKGRKAAPARRIAALIQR